MRTYVLLVLLFGILSFSKLSAQHTEIKNGSTIIKIVMLLKYKDSTCVTCGEALRQRLIAIQGAWNIKVASNKKIATLYMYSDNVIRKSKLRILLSRQDLYH